MTITTERSDNVVAEALNHLAEADGVMAGLIRQHGPYKPRRAAHPDVFQSLSKAIVYQQLAGKAAGSIHRRFTDLVPGTMTADKVLALDPEAIRSAGLSRAKRDAVLDLARHTVAGSLELQDLESLDDDVLTGALCRVRGIGPWTAQMFLLFELGRLNVWPTGDLAVRKGFSLAFGRQPVPTARELEPLGDPFQPYRSLVAWYCWRVLDTITPD
jgi:DNA-3-methyladenine glycosylase II